MKRQDRPSMSRASKNRYVVQETDIMQKKALEEAHNKIYTEMAKRAEEALKLLDPSKTLQTTYANTNKEALRTYMATPYRREKELRDVSTKLYISSQVYRKLIWDNATMIDPTAWVLIPDYVDPQSAANKERKVKDTKKKWFKTDEFIRSMNLETELLKVYLNCWLYDVFFGVYYHFNDGGFILPLDPNYCRIDAVHSEGDYAFSLDCSWLSKYEDDLKFWGEPFVSMHRKYKKNSQKYQWQSIPEQYSVCFKMDVSNHEHSLPPFLPSFNSLMNLEDLKDYQAVQDAANIYKLLVFKMKLKDDGIDEFIIDPKTAVSFYNKALPNIPNYYSSILSPMDIEAINFPNDAANDVDRVENSAKNIFKTTGNSVYTATGTTAMTAQLLSDEAYAISSLLPQTEAFVNRMCRIYLPKYCPVHFLRVTRVSKKDYKDNLRNELNYGLPMQLVLGALDGFSGAEILGLSTFYEGMGLRDLLYPYMTSAQQSAKGRPENDTATDESESSKEKRENNG